MSAGRWRHGGIDGWRGGVEFFVEENVGVAAGSDVRYRIGETMDYDYFGRIRWDCG